jgi:hypothetical protein
VNLNANLINIAKNKLPNSYKLIKYKKIQNFLFQICKNLYTWSSTNGYTITGSCETTCSAVTISLTGTTATAGTTCSSTVFGNVLFSTSHAATFAFNLLAMILSSIMGLFVHF